MIPVVVNSLKKCIAQWPQIKGQCSREYKNRKSCSGWIFRSSYFNYDYWSQIRFIYFSYFRRRTLCVYLLYFLLDLILRSTKDYEQLSFKQSKTGLSYHSSSPSKEDLPLCVEVTLTSSCLFPLKILGSVILFTCWPQKGGLLKLWYISGSLYSPTFRSLSFLPLWNLVGWHRYDGSWWWKWYSSSISSNTSICLEESERRRFRIWPRMHIQSAPW